MLQQEILYEEILKMRNWFQNSLFVSLCCKQMQKDMATYTITINERTLAGKGVLTLLRSLKDVVTIKPNGLDESLSDVKEGRVHYAKNAKDLINQCSR